MTKKSKGTKGTKSKKSIDTKTNKKTDTHEIDAHFFSNLFDEWVSSGTSSAIFVPLTNAKRFHDAGQPIPPILIDEIKKRIILSQNRDPKKIAAFREVLEQKILQ